MSEFLSLLTRLNRAGQPRGASALEVVKTMIEEADKFSAWYGKSADEHSAKAAALRSAGLTSDAWWEEQSAKSDAQSRDSCAEAAKALRELLSRI